MTRICLNSIMFLGKKKNVKHDTGISWSMTSKPSEVIGYHLSALAKGCSWNKTSYLGTPAQRRWLHSGKSPGECSKCSMNNGREHG